MKINEKGLNIIKHFEGFSAKAYLCPAGIWTIGYGHTKGVNKRTEDITTDEAERLLKIDIDDCVKTVADLLNIKVNENQFSALVSLVFNIGQKNFAKSTLLKKINSNEFSMASNEFLRWVYAKGKVYEGLKNRRLAERSLFNEEVL